MIAYKATIYNPYHLTIRSETIESNKISPDLENTKLVYFSDLHLGEYTKDETLDEICETINLLNPDVVVFGGDLFDNYSKQSVGQERINKITTKLKGIKANQGKYYILGNHDLENDYSKETTINILEHSNFMSLINKNVQIHNGTNSFFNIVGLDSLLNGNPDINEAYKDINENHYTLSFIHCPDLFSDLPKENTDYVIAGHSHGGQIYIPLIDNLYRAYGCKEYFYGKHKKENTILDISDGVGLTSYSVRFLTNSEIVLYKFKNN